MNEILLESYFLMYSVTGEIKKITRNPVRSSFFILNWKTKIIMYFAIFEKKNGLGYIGKLLKYSISSIVSWIIFYT